MKLGFGRRISLQVKMSAAFLAMTLMLFLIISVLVNVLLERQFETYVISRQDRVMADAAQLIAGLRTAGDVNAASSAWDLTGLETIGAKLLGEGFILKVTDADGNVVWDANEHNRGRCAEILSHMAHNMAMHAPGIAGAYEERVFELNETGGIATATFGFYGPLFYSDYDIRFLGGLNRMLLWSAVLAALTALAFGILMARRITLPLRRITLASRRIAEGDLKNRLKSDTSTSEIVELADTVNSLAESLQRQEKLRSRLTADVAHELRTPLATIVSHLEAMIDGIWAPTPERLDSLHEEAVRITGLVDDLGRLAAAENGASDLHLEPIDLRKILQRIVLNMEVEFRNKGVGLELVLPDSRWSAGSGNDAGTDAGPLDGNTAKTLPAPAAKAGTEREPAAGTAAEPDHETRHANDELKCEPKCETKYEPKCETKCEPSHIPEYEQEPASDPRKSACMADPGKLSQVFVNLLANALKYTAPGGCVTVTVGADCAREGVSVRDTGIGMPPEELPLIFERFYRTDASRSRSTGGSGIGLAIAKAIMDAHGGTISVESEPGRGSCFTVRMKS